MSDWLDRFAGELGIDPPNERVRSTLLELARDVAHSTERKNAPLSTFLVGSYAARRISEGVDPERAVAEALEAARRLILDTTTGE